MAAMIAMRHWSLRQLITLLVGVLCLALVCILAAGAASIAQSREHPRPRHVRAFQGSAQSGRDAAPAGYLDRTLTMTGTFRT
jgi:hypothetical protein